MIYTHPDITLIFLAVLKMLKCKLLGFSIKFKEFIGLVVGWSLIIINFPWWAVMGHKGMKQQPVISQFRCNMGVCQHSFGYSLMISFKSYSI